MGLVLVETFFEFMLVFLGVWTFESGIQRRILSGFIWVSLVGLMVTPQFWIQETSGGTVKAIFIFYSFQIQSIFGLVFGLISLMVLLSALRDIILYNKYKKAKKNARVELQ